MIKELLTIMLVVAVIAFLFALPTALADLNEHHEEKEDD